MSTFWDDPPPVVKIHNFFFFFEWILPLLILLFEADPTICGHRGHADTSCGLTFSHVYDSVINGDGNYEGTWSQPPLWVGMCW